jgi:hypothetical protein
MTHAATVEQQSWIARRFQLAWLAPLLRAGPLPLFGFNKIIVTRGPLEHV